MAAGETAPAFSIAGVRKAITDIIQACKDVGNALNDCPAKTKFMETATGMTQTLAGLPAEDAAADTIKPEPIIAGLLASLNAATGTLVQTKAGMMADMQASVDREVAKKVAAGELHTHADMVSKCDAARHETHACMMDHMKNFRARMNTLATAKLPVPADDVLSLEEAAFKPRFDAAKTRLDALQPLGVDGDRLQTLCWVSDQSSFDVVLQTLKDSKKTPPNIFENSNPGKAAPGRTRFIGATC